MFCFPPLKHLYDSGVQEKIQKGIYTVGKEDFIHIHPAVHKNALSLPNINSGFAATGLFPFSPDRVPSKFHKTPTLPSTSHSNQFLGAEKMPAKIYQLEQQKKRSESLKSVVSPSIMDEAMRKVIKSTKTNMQNMLPLPQKIDQFLSEDQYRKRRRARTTLFETEAVDLVVVIKCQVDNS